MIKPAVALCRVFVPLLSKATTEVVVLLYCGFMLSRRRVGPNISPPPIPKRAETRPTTNDASGSHHTNTSNDLGCSCRIFSVLFSCHISVSGCMPPWDSCRNSLSGRRRCISNTRPLHTKNRPKSIGRNTTTKYATEHLDMALLR